MATDVQRGGLGFEKFFRRRSSSVERSKDPEKSIKTGKDDAETSAKEEKDTGLSKFGKFFGQKGPEDANNSSDDPKTTAKEITEDSSQKTNESKTSKKNKPGSTESASGKPADNGEGSKVCKEYVIKEDVGQVKLTEIINSSIKEAVLSIVKETVSPLADSLDLRAKDPGKKSPSSVGQEPQDKENKPGSPKHLSSLLSGANKTFDSHLCQSQYQHSSQGPSRGFCKSNDYHEKVSANRSIREGSPCVNKNRKVAKSSKKKEKSVKEGSPKICHQAKGQSSHFRTDNRRMTGNVNIYICSEANENTKDKQKPKSKKDCVDDSESAASSSLSASTSKLVAALRKKQRKNLEDQSSSCVCETPESSVKKYESGCKIDDVDDLLCPCDEDNADPEFLDAQSTSSRDACNCEDTKFSDIDVSGSDVGSFEQPCSNTSVVSEVSASYDADDLWPCTTQDCSNYDECSRGRRFNAPSQDENAEKDLEERCSCYNPNRHKKDRSVVVPCPRNWKSQFEQRKTRDKTCKTPRDTQQFNKCLCIVEEEDEECYNDRKESTGKFTVCGNPSTNDGQGNAENQKNELEKSPSGSASGILQKKNVRSPKAERTTSTRTLDFAAIDSQATLDKGDEPSVKEVDDLKPQSPKPTLLSTLRKNFKRSSSKERRESKVTSPETAKEKDQVNNNEADENNKNAVVSKGDDDENGSPVADEKQKDSFFYRSFKKAIDIVKPRKDNDVPSATENEKTGSYSTEYKTKTKVSNDEGNKEYTYDRSCKGIDKEKSTLNSGNNMNKEKRSRSRISTAIASRRNPAATSNESSNVSISSQANTPDRPANSSAINDTMKPEASGQAVQGLQGCNCAKLPEPSECRCAKPEPRDEESCLCRTKCRKTKSSSSVCCQKLASPRRESFACCPKCGCPPNKCICCSRKSEPIEPDLCKCCPKCSRPISECKCCCSKQKTMDREFCDCCQQPKCLCCCDPEENTRANRSQQKCREPSERQENRRDCSTCCSPKAECRCRSQTFSSWECPKSMICIYCDKPQDNCTCKAPIRKCSQCGLPVDVCNCKPLPCCDCSGRQIVQVEGNDGQTICVTAWKPRRSVRRYFAREENNIDGNSEDDCTCYEKSKPYGSDRLPYQKGAVFSDVMSELQQKMSGSVCCNVCRNVPCNCCCAQTEVEVERRPRQRLCTIAERRSICESQSRSRSKSPADSCRCSTPRRRSGRKAPVSKICDRCRTSPCRCRRGSASPRKKPPAKCYYCKSSPCTCAPISESANPRPFRKADSSRRRRKERNSAEEHVNADVKNEDNGHRGRESNHVVPCPESQQPKKHCCRGNSAGQRTLNLRERAR